MDQRLVYSRSGHVALALESNPKHLCEGYTVVPPTEEPQETEGPMETTQTEGPVDTTQTQGPVDTTQTEGPVDTTPSDGDGGGGGASAVSISACLLTLVVSMLLVR